MKVILFYSIIGLCCFATSAHAMDAAPQLSSDSEQSTAGYYQLKWEGVEGSYYLLQEASDPNFSQPNTLYEGPDTATLISGRSDGTYYYRIRYRDVTSDDFWSNIAQVEVTHHPLSRAFMFFTLGAIVFIATLIVVVIGNRSKSQ